MAASPASPPLPLLPSQHPWLSPPYFLPLVSGWTVAVPEEEQNRQSSPVEYQLTGRWSDRVLPHRALAHGPMVRHFPEKSLQGMRVQR